MTGVIKSILAAVLLFAGSVLSSQAQMLHDIVSNDPLELKLTAIDGSEIDLSKLRGKVVLLDFWAAWCAPCVQEAPKVVATYNKLHEKGFEIIGISLDQSKESVVRFTKKLGMTWPQCFDENKQVSTRFGVEAIPTMLLIDKKGHIASLDAREDLTSKVENLLSQ